MTVRGGVGLFGGTPLIKLSNSNAANGITRTFAGFFAPFFGDPVLTEFNNAVADLPNATAISSRFQQFLGVNPDSDIDAIFQPSNIPLADVAISGDGSQFIYSPSSSATASAADPNVARLPSVYRIQIGLRYRF